MTSDPPPLARVVVRNAVWTSLGSYAVQVIGFGSNLILTRLLPVETFGFFSMATFWVAQLNLRGKAGLDFAAFQENGLSGELLGTYYVLDLALAGLQFLLAIVGASVLAWLNYPAPVVIGLIVLMTAECIPAFIGPLNMALEKELQLSRQMLLTVFGSLLSYAVAVTLALLRHDIWSLLAINTILVTFGMFGEYWLARVRLPKTLQTPWTFSRELAKQLVRRGLPTGLSLTAVLGFVAVYDNFLVGTFVGYGPLGFYDRAFRTAQWPNILLTTVISRVGFITFARVRDDMPRLTHAVRLSLWLLVTLGMPMGLALAFAAPEVIGVLYGPVWLPSAAYLPYIAIYALASLFWSIGFWLSVARKDSRVSVSLAGSQAIILIVLATPLTWRFGITGTLVGVGLTNAFALGLSIWYIFRTVPLSPANTLGPPVLATILAVIGLSLLAHLPGWLSLPAVIRLVVVGLAAASIYWLALFALAPAEMIERVRYLKAAWRRP